MKAARPRRDLISAMLRRARPPPGGEKIVFAPGRGEKEPKRGGENENEKKVNCFSHGVGVRQVSEQPLRRDARSRGRNVGPLETVRKVRHKGESRVRRRVHPRDTEP